MSKRRPVRPPTDSERLLASLEGSQTYRECMSALTSGERRFVRGLIRQEDPELAADAAGMRDDARVIDLLGRPQIRRAILTLAPLLATTPTGEALARVLVRPYALQRQVRLLDNAGTTGLSAARDLLETSTPTKGDPRRAWEARAAGRAREDRATGAADKAGYGTSASTARDLPKARA